MTEKWTLERYDNRERRWTSYFGAHFAQWDGAVWEVEESHTLERCLHYVRNNTDHFVAMRKYNNQYRLHEEVSGETYPLDLFL